MKTLHPFLYTYEYQGAVFLRAYAIIPPPSFNVILDELTFTMPAVKYAEYRFDGMLNGENFFRYRRVNPPAPSERTSSEELLRADLPDGASLHPQRTISALPIPVPEPARLGPEHLS